MVEAGRYALLPGTGMGDGVLLPRLRESLHQRPRNEAGLLTLVPVQQ